LILHDVIEIKQAEKKTESKGRDLNKIKLQWNGIEGEMGAQEDQN